MQNKNASIEGIRIGIVGSGVSGLSLASLAKRKKARVFVSDSGAFRETAAKQLESMGIAFEFGEHGPRLWESDLIVLSSGVAPSAVPVQEARKRGIPLVGELDFVAPYLKGKRVGVTGSNGKSTTTALLGHLLQKMGMKAAAVGNIGSPLADYADLPLDVLVMELSSFQLFWANRLPVDVAVVTNLDPDHIDWHGSYENYVAAKANLLRMQKAGSWAILQGRDLHFFQEFDAVRKISLGSNDEFPTEGRIVMGEREAVLWTEKGPKRLFTFDSLPLLGKHNLENAAMAMAALEALGFDASTAEPLLGSFSALPHRCEAVATINGVRYVDDSKGTNVAASVTALGSLPGVKLVILGGQGKGEDYTPLAQAVKRHARLALVMGTEREKICDALKDAGFEGIRKVRDMEEAVATAYREALAGETVLLSPACTSWDAYPNYKERGKHFQRLVLGIREGEGLGEPAEGN